MPSPPSTTTSRKVKLRNACNNCCAAKVKCSGEKTGCERCRNAETACVYAESMVGKVPGVRAKRKQAIGEDSEQRSSRRSSVAQWSASLPGTSRGAGFHTIEQASMISWPSNWQSQQEAADSPDVLSTQHNKPDPRYGSYNSKYTSSAIDHSAVPNTDAFFMDLLLPQSPAQTPIEEAHDEPQIDYRERALRRSYKAPPNADNKCCLECCQIIYDLENYIMSDMKAFKIILGIIRQTQEKLNDLVDLQRDSLNPRCSMLFNTILYQILELMAMCLSTLESEPDQWHGRLHAGISVGLGLGYSSIDAEEQSRLGMQIIAGEARRATDFLRKVESLVPRPRDGASVGQRGAGRDAHLDLELRFQEISRHNTREN
ncbi:hypothetical protein GGR51DRAFT_494783 [Nemania sp. FL0031]|nr:hypothetical protein GGR51DRAFT_494783 [Nemania sp. FL0031]